MGKVGLEPDFCSHALSLAMSTVRWKKKASLLLEVPCSSLTWTYGTLTLPWAFIEILLPLQSFLGLHYPGDPINYDKYSKRIPKRYHIINNTL